jgi:hypothetical protein
MKQAMKWKCDVGMQKSAEPIEGFAQAFMNTSEHGGSLALNDSENPKSQAPNPNKAAKISSGIWVLGFAHHTPSVIIRT